MDTMRKGLHPRCPAEDALDLIGGRWKVPVLWNLFGQKPMRFSELKRRLPACTAKMLTQHLREMEADHLVKRKIYAEVPPRVEYSLTPKGASLKEIVEAMCRWGKCRTRS